MVVYYIVHVVIMVINRKQPVAFDIASGGKPYKIAYIIAK